MKHAPEVPTTVVTAGKPVTPLLAALPGCQWPRNSGSTQRADLKLGAAVGGDGNGQGTGFCIKFCTIILAICFFSC
jgi:hypothetical protein